MNHFMRVVLKKYSNVVLNELLVKIENRYLTRKIIEKQNNPIVNGEQFF